GEQWGQNGPLLLRQICPSHLPILPTSARQTLGTRLHEHLLALAAEQFTHHVGTTAAENLPMRRIYQKNGSRPTVTQMYFRPA
ncbi:hypothetical protein HNQ10_004322, partial [Deinococcus metallilatus]|nr:hypothetical protein [Deinococcus metallilatus]